MAISPINPHGLHAMLHAVTETGNRDSIMTEHSDIPDLASTPNDATVRQAAANLNRLAQTAHTALSFEIDDSTGKTVIKVMDTENNELIRQIPSEEALALSHAIDIQQGLMLKTQS